MDAADGCWMSSGFLRGGWEASTRRCSIQPWIRLEMVFELTNKEINCRFSLFSVRWRVWSFQLVTYKVNIFLKKIAVAYTYCISSVCSSTSSILRYFHMTTRCQYNRTDDQTRCTVCWFTIISCMIYLIVFNCWNHLLHTSPCNCNELLFSVYSISEYPLAPKPLSDESSRDIREQVIFWKART